MERGFDIPYSQSLLPETVGANRAHRTRNVAAWLASGAAIVGALALLGVVASHETNQPAVVTSLVETIKADVDAAARVGASATVRATATSAKAPAATSVTPAVATRTHVKESVGMSVDSTGHVDLVKSQTFDDDGRYILRNFDRVKPMASFLPGVGGLWGVPMWAFYVNRGQGMATFGVENKQGGLLLFQTAEKAYTYTPTVGFRTLIKGTTASGDAFEAQPFLPESDASESAATRNMYLGNNEMEVEELDPKTGIRTSALYFTVPQESFPALVRRVTFTNEGTETVSLEVVDGLAKLEPSGTTIEQISAMGRTLEGWMNVYNFGEGDHTAPFFHLVSAPADTADVTLIKDGYFAVAMLDDAAVGADGARELLPMICDQQMLFGTDTTLSVPRNFFSSKTKPTGTPLGEILRTPQSTTSRTPSAFTAASFELKPGASKTLSIIFGHAPDLDTYKSEYLPKLRTAGYVVTKRAAAVELGAGLTNRVAMSSGVPQMDGYAKQNYLDNGLRGGIPMLIGDGAHSTDDSTGFVRPKIFHAFSRIHGDLERDYNNFVIEPTYWSQGPGNFRDVNQNRRCDVLQLPAVHDFNVRQFLSYVQADGYNQLTVATAFFKIFDDAHVAEVAATLAPSGGAAQKSVAAILAKPFRPGQLFNDLKKANIEISMDKDALLVEATKYAMQVPGGNYTQNGFWTDHFTYTLDLVHNFVAVFPDEKESMLFDSAPVPFFMSPGRAVNRTEKNMLVAEGKVRSYDAVMSSPAKLAELQKIFGDKGYVGDAASGGVWQRCAKGYTFRVSIIAKLITLAVTKFAIMDPLGMGLEMEAGKPGWNDAMNGLPGLFGSEMPSAYELYEIIDFVGDAIDEAGRGASLPEEVAGLLGTIDAQLVLLSSGAVDDFTYWDKVRTALEAYRWSTDATFTGEFIERDAASLGKATGVFGRMAQRMQQGAARALAYAPDAAKKISPSYFQFTVTKYSLTGKVSARGLPTVQIEGFAPSVLPLFLEGPTRHLKTLKRESHSTKLAVYTAVEASPLHDTELGMYKIGESLKGQPMEIGRMMAFSPGWLENESIWLHMSYKWYLELLRAGLYEQYFKEIKKGVVCFMDTDVFGRSPTEAASFIVSSAFADKSLHGSGFLARLSGTTAEFLSMWNHMMVGPAPFTLSPAGELQLELAPVIASWMWREDGTLLFKFLGGIEVKYVMAAKKNSWESTITSYALEGPAGTAVIQGATVPKEAAQKIRALGYTKMTVTLA